MLQYLHTIILFTFTNQGAPLVYGKVWICEYYENLFLHHQMQYPHLFN